MQRLRRGWRGVAGGVALLGLCLAAASAQTPPITMALVANKTSYLPTEPIQLQITVANTSGQTVIAREGFLEQSFERLLLFITPDGQPLRTRFEGGGAEPGPSPRFQGQAVAPVELIPAGEQRTLVIEDARFYYDLSQFGRYTAQVVTSLETFSQFVEEPNTGARFAFLTDPGRQGFDPLASNKIAFTIVSPAPGVSGTIQVSVTKHTTGKGSKPEAKKTPLENVMVRLIRRAAVPANLQPINFKTYELIYHTVDPIATASTASDGMAKFPPVKQDDYIVIALFTGSQDFRHMGSPVDASDQAWGTQEPIRKHLVVMEKAK